MIPFDDRDGFIWYNGKLTPWRECKLHVLSHGLHYGGAVFEGTRVYNGKCFKVNEHNERLHKSAEILGFEIPFTVEEINAACEEVVRENGVINGYLRPIAWRGSEMIAVSAQACKIHLAIASWEWPSYFGQEAKEKGLRMCWADWKRPSPETAPVASKAAGLYMIATLNKHSAEKQGFQDAMMLDWRGYIAEATGANVFFIHGNEIHTPTPDCFLNGITRRTVIGLAEKAGFQIIERHIEAQELASFEQAFLTGTAAEVTPIGCIHGKYGDFNFTVGEATKRLMADYEALTQA
ncbi:MAG: branched-chain amino acid aminotransferase [Alphaproteobacteria bacterium CG11_big_fil_rev_8_21_14_0_20_44_7]|nr:MAG: branched-chain amino acid aminotransferase [Alphaproteobacteria bacterium CG11_big_fil_rev_8_21_14_0_20_44_7]